jgi:DNA (cytosine-5)-methyltransferase 1
MSGNNQPVVSYGFDQGATRDVGKLWLEEQSKTLTNGTFPGHHNGVVVAIPCTVEPGIAAREGGHIYEGVSGTLRANAGDNQMAVAYAENCILDDQGGSQISVREDGKCPTLRAEMHGNVPCVLAAGGFCPETGGNDPSRSVAFQEELSPTLRAGATPAIVGVYKADDGSTGNASPTPVGDHNNRVTDHSALVLCCEPVAYNGENITSPLNKTNPQPGDPCHTLGTDSRNYVVCLEGNGSRPSHRGDGWRESETMYTLNATEQHSVAYSLETFHCEAEEEITAPLKARDYKDPVCVLDRAFFNQGKNAQYEPQFYTDGTVPTLVAKGPAAVQIRYIVRRLTPTECARLQGFPDRWAVPDKKDSFTDEEYEFWLNVRNTHAEINGKATKDYTKDQMLRWYNKLHTDSSEYKLWGNGIALPTALYMMQGIAEVFANERG